MPSVLSNSRGFSLLLVLLVTILLGIVGMSAVAVSTGEAGTAAARNVRRQALAAAETGLQNFMGIDHSGGPSSGTYYIGAAGDAETSFRYLPDVPGEDLQSRYRVSRVAAGAPNLPANMERILVEGQVVRGTAVLARASLTVVAEIVIGTAGSDAQIGQEDLGASGGSSYIPGVNDQDISLDF